MAKKVIELDTPFRVGEKVITVRDLPGIPEGTPGKVRLVNGLSDYNGGRPWLRYWVRMTDGTVHGQIDHGDLVRPKQLGQWRAREEERIEAANRPDEPEAAEAVAEVGAGGGGGIESQIPAHLLERSKAAKARLLG